MGLEHTGPGDSLRADQNWWGASPPQSSWFYGKVDRTPWLAAPPAKVLVPEEEEVVIPAVPAAFSVSQNYPNPFNSSTVIEFSLPSLQRVTVEVFNILGQRVRTLADREFGPGQQRVAWDGTGDNGRSVASGIYFYRVVSGDFQVARQMVLIK